MASVPFQNVAHGTPEALREFIHEALGLAIIQAEIGMRYAETGDDRGLEYSYRRHVAYLRAVAGALRDLRAPKLQRGAS